MALQDGVALRRVLAGHQARWISRRTSLRTLRVIRSPKRTLQFLPDDFADHVAQRVLVEDGVIQQKAVSAGSSSVAERLSQRQLRQSPGCLRLRRHPRSGPGHLTASCSAAIEAAAAHNRPRTAAGSHEIVSARRPAPRIPFGRPLPSASPPHRLGHCVAGLTSSSQLVVGHRVSFRGPRRRAAAQTVLAPAIHAGLHRPPGRRNRPPCRFRGAVVRCGIRGDPRPTASEGSARHHSRGRSRGSAPRPARPAPIAWRRIGDPQRGGVRNQPESCPLSASCPVAAAVPRIIVVGHEPPDRGQHVLDFNIGDGIGHALVPILPALSLPPGPFRTTDSESFHSFPAHAALCRAFALRAEPPGRP